MEKTAGMTPETDQQKTSGPSYRNPSDSDLTTPKELPSLFLKSICMGSADVVPGVSGGTMALILGLYSRLINAIRSVNLTAIKLLLTFNLKGFFDQVHWKFGLTLMAGIFGSLLFFTKVVPLPVMMYTHPEIIYGLFFGLILGSVVLLVINLDRYGLREFSWMVFGTFIGYRIVTLVPTDTPEHPLFLFITGSFSISAMVLPGISGSFILLILRKYDTVLGAIGNLGTAETMNALFILVPFGFGIVFGLVVFARILGWLLNRFYLPTVCLLIGFMAGSLYIIWPFQDREFIQTERTEIVSVDDSRVAMAGEPEILMPEFYLTGDVINPDAPANEQMIELKRVSNKLISSHPFWPANADQDDRLSDGSSSVVYGFVMMGTGLLAVLLLGFVSRRKGGEEHPVMP